MKKLIFILLCFTVFSCNIADAIDEEKCLSNVVDAFPKGKIYTGLPDNDFEFIVVDSNKVFFVETKSIRSPKITSVILLRVIKNNIHLIELE